MNINDYYDSIANISILTREAIAGVAQTRAKLQESLIAVNKLKKQREVPISFVSDVTVNDVHRNLLFFQFLMTQVSGLIQAPEIQELLQTSDHLSNGDEF